MNLQLKENVGHELEIYVTCFSCPLVKPKVKKFKL